MPKVGLISAMKCELPDIIPCRNSKQIQIYTLGDFDIGVIISGVGPENAKTATKKLYSEYKPDRIVVLGICGGSQTKLAIGDIVVADKIHYNGNEVSSSSPQLEDVKTCLSKNLIPYHVGKLQTFDHPVLSRKEVLADVLGV
ncbi:MAG: 5'-methylthioadenosine/S-adenosylhomocysteine nucleosidase family protein, partial [Promethearchaeota archaeon]